MAETNNFPVTEHTQEGSTNSQLHIGSTSISPGVTYTQSGAAIARDATVSKSCDEIRNETLAGVTKGFDGVKQMYENRLEKFTDMIRQLEENNQQLEEKNQQLEEEKKQSEEETLLLKRKITQQDIQASMEKNDTQIKADDMIRDLEVEVRNERESRDRLQRYIIDLSIKIDQMAGLTSEFKQHTRKINHKVHTMNDGESAGAKTPDDIDLAVMSIMGNLECLQKKLIELKTFKKTNYNTVLELTVRKDNLEKKIKESSEEINFLTTGKSELENKYKEVDEKCKLLQRRIDEYKAISKSTGGPSSVTKTTPPFKKTQGQIKPEVEENAMKKKQPRTQTSPREDSYSSANKISHATFSSPVTGRPSHSTEQGKSLIENAEHSKTSTKVKVVRSTSLTNSPSSRKPETKMQTGVTGNAFEKSTHNVKPGNGTTRGVKSAEEREIKQSQNAKGGEQVSRERKQPLQIGNVPDAKQGTQHTGKLHTGVTATCTVQTMALGKVRAEKNPPKINGKRIEVAAEETLQTDPQESNSEKLPPITNGTLNGNQHTQE